MVEVPAGHLFLGDRVDPSTHERQQDNVLYEAANLTTHGMIVGMTGSGKTGLSIIMLEEALLQGIPTLIIDPKGDMGNLLLNFPDLGADDFAPWVNDGDDPSAIAGMWKGGLESWGIGGDRLRQLRDGTNFTIYTPGSTSGVPLNLIGDLKAPVGASAEAQLEEIEGFATSLLGLVGIDADPLASREHILLTNIINHAWSNGTDLDIGTLVGQIQTPPIRKLGVLDLESFYPAKDRTALAMKLNGLLASPAFTSWMQGDALDIETLLNGGDGTNAAIVSLAHLSDEERQFVVTLLLSKLITWMRQQPGTPDLRTLVYMDEVFGYVPPTANPPSKKPILTILKQARAFGVGMVLSTQNPVDIDYKAISNAGTWMIGRLQTEQDKKRLLDGLSSASGEVDVKAVDKTISGLDKREFVLQSAADGLHTFTTRWAMSYLSGPLTRDQISTLMANRSGPPAAPVAPAPPAAAPAASTASPAPPAAAPAAAPAPAPAPAAPAAAALADDETNLMPPVADGVDVYYLDTAAPWSGEVGAAEGGRRLQAGVVARVNLLFDEGDLREQQEWEAVWFPLDGKLDGSAAIAVDYDDRDLQSDAPAGAVYVLPDAKIHTKTFFSQAQSSLKDHLYRNETIELFRNRDLKLTSRIGETREEFEKRCLTAADDEADAEAAKIRDSLETKRERIDDAIQKAEDRVREIQHDAESRSKDEKMSIVADVAGSVLGGLLGGRRSARGLISAGRRVSSKRRTTGNAKQRLESAENRLEEKIDDLEALEDELHDTLIDINEEWDEKAGNIEDMPVGLEKTDISIDDLALLWIPTA